MKILRNKRNIIRFAYDTLEEFLASWADEDDIVKISTIDTVETSDFIIVEYVECQTSTNVATVKITFINGHPVEVELLRSTRIKYEY